MTAHVVLDDGGYLTITVESGNTKLPEVEEFLGHIVGFMCGTPETHNSIYLEQRDLSRITLDPSGIPKAIGQGRKMLLAVAVGTESSMLLRLVIETTIAKMKQEGINVKSVRSEDVENR